MDQLSRMHLRYTLTCELTLWIDKLITYITNPLNNDGPEPHSKPYNAGNIELPIKKTSRKKKKNPQPHAGDTTKRQNRYPPQPTPDNTQQSKTRERTLLKSTKAKITKIAKSTKAKTKSTTQGRNIPTLPYSNKY
jgi:hypothetical protein